MANPEKDLADDILKGQGLSPSKLGLRFDRVVVRVMRDLRAFADGAASDGTTVVVTLTAPIRVPAQTVEALRQAIGAMLSAGPSPKDHSDTVHGNQVSLRLVEHRSAARPKLVGFVHNPGDGRAPQLLDLAERWLRG
jgi:hypothetical protein